MKILAIAGKDLLRLVRSPSFLTFGLFIPLLMGAIFYLAFGGIGSGDEGFSVAPTRVQVANLDTPDSVQSGFSAGRLLVDVLSSAELSSLLEVSEAKDAAAARGAVDRQEVGVAVIIPAGLTGAILTQGESAAVEIYSDPTLTLGPSIVQSVVRSLVDYYTGSTIAGTVAAQQLAARGGTFDRELSQELALQYAAWASETSRAQQAGTNQMLDVRAPAAEGAPARDLRLTIVSTIMAGMIVFYVFFSGASSAESLLVEEERGTLARVFTTPTPVRDVLGGRIAATYVMLTAQVVVLLVSSWLIFGIRWGHPLPIGLVAGGMIVLAASFGLFLTSLVRSTRQGGLVYGGLLTIMGMVGMISIFGMAAPAAPRTAMQIASLFTPHGWAVRGWLQLLDGAGTLEVLPVVAVMLVLGAAFFVGGLVRFRKRFV